MRADQEIKNSIARQFENDTRVSLSDIDIEAKNGVVKLTGHVPSNIALQAADDDAWEVPGVIDVVNQLMIRYPATEPIPSDEELKENVQSVLSWDPDIDASTIKVKVESGIINLEGSVDALWKKFHVADKVMGISGILGVDNKITIVPTKGLTDENIAQTIIDCLENHRDIELEALNIRVENGIVTLSGRQPDIHARQHAYNTVTRVEGVTDVLDNISIGP